MLGFFNDSDKNDRVLKKMKSNRKRIFISSTGVVRLNLKDEDVKAKIKDDVEKLEKLHAG
ncbi:hypothetical protein NM22_02955 [Vibrio tubiashii]|nr:hypothetical protein NM22_02955 [Vibrio tubiashii]